MEEILIKFKEEIINALRIRLVEQKLLDLFSQGKLNGTVHTAIGQEFVGVFVSKYLNSEDFVTSNHRGHGHYISRYGNVRGLISELMGKTSGISGGMGGSQHLVDQNFLSNGIQGGMLPIAAGVAFYYKVKRKSSISISYIGDGTLGEGIVYETMNLAAVYNLPMIIVLENNGIAQSTSMKQTFRGDVKKRAESFGWNYRSVCSRDLVKMDSVIMESIDYVRKSSMPLFLEIESYRLMSHSKGDDNRKTDEVEGLRKSDVLNKALSLKLPWLEEAKIQISSEIENIVQEVLLTPDLVKTSFGKEVFNTRSRIDEVAVENNSGQRYNELIYEALRHSLEKNKDGLIVGEDIQNRTEYTEYEYGGAFKVTRDLSDLFPGRVLNSPISEAALYGFGTGYSMKAGRSFVEIMFGDFTTLIFDQILQHSSKFTSMYNGRVKSPVVVRTPMGGKRGYGPTHSQSIEKHFLGIDNFVVIALNHRISPTYLYSALFTIDNPVMIVENKILYTLVGNKKKLNSYDYSFSQQLFPYLLVSPLNLKPTVTILCYGEVLNEVEEALRNLMFYDEIFCEIICPSLISEIDPKPIVDSLKRTSTLLIVEEGSGYASWGSEVVSAVNTYGYGGYQICRLSNDLTIPSSYSAELEQIPNSRNIINQIKLMVK